MNTEDKDQLIKELRALPKESEWVEFKGNNWNPDTLGANIQVISNAELLISEFWIVVPKLKS